MLTSFLNIFRKSDTYQKIGQGISRAVFTIPSVPSMVFKIPLNPQSYSANILEATAWRRFSNDPQKSRWLAPVVECTESGDILAMVRTERINFNEIGIVWRNLPHFIGDIHAGNLGMLQNEIVCHDYAIWNP